MTRPRVVPARGGPDGGTTVATAPVVSVWSVWSSEPEPPVTGALSRYSLVLPGPRSLLDRGPVR